MQHTTLRLNAQKLQVTSENQISSLLHESYCCKSNGVTTGRVVFVNNELYSLARKSYKTSSVLVQSKKACRSFDDDTYTSALSLNSKTASQLTFKPKAFCQWRKQQSKESRRRNPNGREYTILTLSWFSGCDY